MTHISITSDIEKPKYSHAMFRKTDTNGTRVEIKETHAYKWTIETALGTFTGTCLSINDLNEEIIMLTNNSKILRKNITPVTLKNENVGNKIYTWHVTTNSGEISGVSVSLEDAKKAINAFGYKEVVNSNIDELSAQ